MCRSAGRSRTTGTSLVMFRTRDRIALRDAARRADRLAVLQHERRLRGWPVVANRWPGVTAPVSVTVRPPGASRRGRHQPPSSRRRRCRPESTMTAKSLSAGEADCCVCHGVLPAKVCDRRRRRPAQPSRHRCPRCRGGLRLSAARKRRIVSRTPSSSRVCGSPATISPQRRVVERGRHRNRRAVDRDQPARRRPDLVFHDGHGVARRSGRRREG